MISAFKRLEAGGSQRFKVILGYVPSLKSAQAVGDPVSKIKGGRGGRMGQERRVPRKEKRKWAAVGTSC